MTVSRTIIEKALKRLNDAENRRPHVSVEETIAGIDAVMAADVEGWTNGVYKPNREAERQGERALFEAIKDYHRDIDRVIIDPPFVAFSWRVKGSAGGNTIGVEGCSIG